MRRLVGAAVLAFMTACGSSGNSDAAAAAASDSLGTTLRRRGRGLLSRVFRHVLLR